MTPGRTPDPVEDPTGYQRFILSLLGEDDPAEVQAGTPDAVGALLADAGKRVAERPEPAEWSMLQCMDHARAGVHEERGLESYALIFRRTAGHDRFHIDQARRALAAVTA